MGKSISWNRIVAESFERHIAEVLLIAHTDDGELTVVRFHDGGWGLARDRKPMQQYYWPPNHFDACVETFVRLAKINPLPDSNKKKPGA